MAAAEVHVSVPAFSRLCLLCNSCSAAPQPAGGLQAVLSDPAVLTELRRRLTGLDQELALVNGVCPACRRRLLRCQRLLLRFRAAADALSVTYRRAAAARRHCRVLLRRGRRRSEVTFSTCCQLAAGRPPPTQPADLLRHLVTEAFGAAALEGRMVISSSVPPPAGDAAGLGQDTADRHGATDEGSECSDDSVTLSLSGKDRDLAEDAGAVWPADGGTLTGSGGAAAKHATETWPNSGNIAPESLGVSAAPAVGDTRQRHDGPWSSSVNEDDDGDDDVGEEDGDGEEQADWSDLDWPAGRPARRGRKRAADPTHPQSQADDQTDSQPRPARRGRRRAADPAHPQSQADGQTDPQSRPALSGRRGRPPRGAHDGRFCHMCRQSFRSERSLKAHVEKLHKVAGPAEPEEPVRVWCPACSALLPPADVTGHLTEQHGGRLDCGCCRVELEDAAAAARHCVEQHTANYMCIVCLQMYSGQDQLISHMNSSHEPSPSEPGPADRPAADSADPVAAVYTDLVRRLRGRARRLQLSLLGRTAVRCPYCAQTCSLHYLRTHLYKHRSPGFTCRACEKRFKFPVSFQKHLLLHAGRADKCPQCDAVFSSRSNLLSHLRTHSAERQFSCDRCQKQFKFKQTRDAHVRRTHGGGAAKVCDVCGAEFRLQYQLTVHLARHSNGRSIRCPLCPRLYELNLDLKRHLYSKHKIRVAEAERRFPEIRRRPNTALEPAAEPGPDGQLRPAPPPAGSVYPGTASAAVAADAEYLSADDPPPADGFLAGAGAGAADEGAAQLEVSRIITVPPELLSAGPLDGAGGAAAAGAGQMLLLVDGADVGMLMRDVLPASSTAF